MKFTLICSFVLLPFLVSSKPMQNGNLNPKRLESQEYALEVKDIVSSLDKLPFSSIKIIDSRFDTSKIGFKISNNFSRDEKKYLKKIMLTGGVAKSIEGYYNKYYQNSFEKNGYELLIVLKKFWLSNVNIIPDKKRENAFFDSKIIKNFYYKLECYIGKDTNYLPVKRIDKVYSFSRHFSEEYKDEFKEKHLPVIKNILKEFVESIDFKKCIGLFSTQPKKSLSEILVYNESRFKLSILKDTFINKGVYTNFDEFKKNKPTLSDFVEKNIKNKQGALLIENINGEEVNEYWGYYKSKIFKVGKLVNETLYRVGNTYEFFIKRTWVEEELYTQGYPYSGVNNNRYTKPTTHWIWIPCQIDMETGEIY